jgi:hypothetical protein
LLRRSEECDVLRRSFSLAALTEYLSCSVKVLGLDVTHCCLPAAPVEGVAIASAEDRVTGEQDFLSAK